MLAIVWTCLICFVIPIQDTQADMKNKPIKVTCNDDKINYPIVAYTEALARKLKCLHM
jgi:hypothetical protein